MKSLIPSLFVFAGLVNLAPGQEAPLVGVTNQVSALINKSSAHLLAGQWAEAEMAGRKARELTNPLGNTKDERLLKIRVAWQLGNVYFKGALFDRAEPEFEFVISEFRGGTPQPAMMIMWLRNAAKCENQLRKYDEARAHLLEAMDWAARKSPDSIAAIMRDAAFLQTMVMLAANDQVKAELAKFFENLAETAEAGLKENDPRLAQPLRDLGRFYRHFKVKRDADAVPVYARIIRILETDESANRFALAEALDEYADLQNRTLKQRAEAAKTALRGWRLLKDDPGALQSQTFRSLCAFLGSWHQLTTKNQEAALGFYQQAWQVAKNLHKLDDSNDSRLRMAQEDLAEALIEIGEFERAEELLNELRNVVWDKNLEYEKQGILMALEELEKKRGNPEASLEMQRAQVELAERKHGPTSRSTIFQVRALAWTLWSQGKHLEAIALLEERLRLLQTSELPESTLEAQTAAVLNSLGSFRLSQAVKTRSQADWDVAGALLRDSVAIHERVSGHHAQDTIEAMLDLARCFQYQGRTAAARDLVLLARERATTLRTKTGDIKTFLRALASHADFSESIADWETALAIRQDIVDLNREAYQSSDFRHVGALELLVLAQQRAGDHQSALQTIATLEAADPREDYSNLKATSLAASGNLDQARQLNLALLEAAKKAGDATQIAKILDALAETEFKSGNSQIAAKYLGERLKILQTADPKSYRETLPQTIFTLVVAGQISEARPLIEQYRTLPVPAKNEGVAVEGIMVEFSDLMVAIVVGDETKARSVAEALKDEMLAQFGANEALPELAQTLRELEEACYTSEALNRVTIPLSLVGGNTSKLVLIYRSALAASIREHGPESQETAINRLRLAQNLDKTGQPGDALWEANLAWERLKSETDVASLTPRADLLQLLVSLNRRAGNWAAVKESSGELLKLWGNLTSQGLISTAFRFQQIEAMLHTSDPAVSEALEQALNSQENDLEDVLRFASEHQRLHYQTQQRGYLDLVACSGDAPLLAQVLIRQKGVILDSLLEDRLLLASIRNAADSPLSELAQERQSLREKLRRQAFDPGATGPGNESQTRRLDEIESELSSRLARYRPARSALQTSQTRVRQALGDRGILLDYFRFRNLAGIDHYGVLELRANQKPVWYDLGPTSSMDEALDLYQKAVRRYTNEATLRKQLRLLHAKLLPQSVRDLVADGNWNLVISPDARLNFVSFGTLLSGQDRLLLQDFQLRYVASARDLLEDENRAAQSLPNRMLLLAAPDYRAPLSSSAISTALSQESWSAEERQSLRQLGFKSLTGAAQIESSLKTWAQRNQIPLQSFNSSKATEAAFRQSAGGASIIHLATHGVFLKELPLLRAIGPASLSFGDLRNADNPMHRGMLALASAKTTVSTWKASQAVDPARDGLLTADEAADLDLAAAKLVVLSACKTGVGADISGEGVLGLRRGFAMAGAKEQIFTLWPVDDVVTAQVMATFYDEYAKTGLQDAARALIATQRTTFGQFRSQHGLQKAIFYAGPFVSSSKGPVR